MSQTSTLTQLEARDTPAQQEVQKHVAPSVVVPPFELPNPNIPIDFPNFIYYPPIVPICAINTDLAHCSSTTRRPKYMGHKKLAKISARRRDQHRFILGIRWTLSVSYREVNAFDRFELLLQRICGFHTDKDIHPVLMIDGMAALCATFAQNLMRKTMGVDVVKFKKVKKFPGTTEEPRWYKYDWHDYHDE